MAKPYHKNPRQITAKQYEALAIDLAELGDLGGIVHDLNSDEIIGGNQRGRVFDINDCDVVLTEVLDQPDEQGTVAHGYVIWKGHKYAYRQVRWTARQCERANIVANKRGGTWDFDILADQFEQDDLLAWGFEPFELGIGDDLEPEPGDGEPQTVQQARATLAERFLVPPFSVLDARQGYWQTRKAAWIALGIQSELGRGENANPGGSPRPAASLQDGHTVRGDGRGMAMYDSAKYPTALARKRSYDKRGGVRMALETSPTVQRLKPSADQAAKHARRRNDQG